jgi:DNA-binding GntR family transcriptional regulator
MDGAPAAEIKYRTASEHAFRLLKRWILAGDLPPGSTIDLTGLSRRLGMSRMPIRTALERLDSESLVMLTPHRGAVVAPISAQEMQDLYFVRHQLEGVAVEMAARNMTADVFDELERILTTTEQQVAAGDLEGFLASNRMFHTTVYRASGNRVLQRVIDGLWDLSERYRRAYLAQPARAEVSTAEHRRLYELLREGRATAARAFMQEHNDKTMRVLLDAYGAETSGTPR